ncbi:GNAT family N-acetyltransferase [Enterococcus sp. AZ180]|uniref:GNAT family N-acetyltransferase n=1 Tax=Enterococcus sp. AZ180 TaxID=2774961 RepID=UPI003F227234
MFSKILKRKEAENLIWDQLKFIHNQAFLPTWEFEPEMEFVKYFAVSFQEKDGAYLEPSPYAEEHAAFIHDPENKDLKDKSFQNFMFEKYPDVFLESYALAGFISLEVKKYGAVGRKYLHISDIAVDKSMRRNGIAFKLAIQVVAFADKEKMPVSIHSWVKPENYRANVGQSDTLIRDLGFKYVSDIYSQPDEEPFKLKRFERENSWKQGEDLTVTEEVAELTREEKKALRDKLVFRSTADEREFKAIVFFMHEKYPEMWRAKHKIQWKFKIPARSKGFYGTVIYNNAEEMQPVGFASGWFDHSKKENADFANGGIAYIAPHYRRMGIMSLLYTIHEEKIRRFGGKYALDVQIGGNVAVSEKLGHIVVNKGRLTGDGTYSQVKVLIPLDTEESKQKYADTINGKIEWEEPLDFEFLKTYKLTVDYLNQPWDNPDFKEKLKLED